MQAASEEVRHEEVEEDDEEGLEDYTGPKPWQRFFLGYRERFVEDCVLELQVRRRWGGGERKRAVRWMGYGRTQPLLFQLQATASSGLLAFGHLLHHAFGLAALALA